MTTPNACWIPQPCFLFRDVNLRQDGLLGHEDPLLWPQLYCEELPYLACISLAYPKDSHADFLCRGVTPEDVEFTAPITAYPRHCRLSLTHASRCREIWNHAKSTFTAHLAKHGPHNHKRLEVITSQLGLASSSIARLEGTFLELRFRFALLCRLFLELEGYYTYHALRDSHEFSMAIRPVDNSLVGVITTDETVCHRFHRMGVPVWFTRLLEPNHGTPCRLLTEKLPLNADSRETWPHGRKIVISRIPNIAPVFEGSFDDPNYLVKISDWVRDCLRTDLGSKHPLHSFLSSYQRKPRPTPASDAGVPKKRKAPWSDDVTPKRITNKRQVSATAGVCTDGEGVYRALTFLLQHHRPQRTAKPKVRRFSWLGDLFDPWPIADLEVLLALATPQPTEAWRTADGEIPPEERPSLHLVPALDIFTKVDSVLQLKRFVYTWVKIRNRWLQKVSEELQAPDFSTRRAWRTFMRGSFDPEPINPESEAGKSRLRFTAYMGLPEPPTHDIASTSLGSKPPSHLDRTVDRHTVEEILRQVNQVNFFYDVFEVELKRTWDLPSTILERLQPITHNRQNYFANPNPLVLTKLEERASWLLAFRDVITPWPCTIPKSSNFALVPRQTDRGLNVQDIIALELALARFYCYAAEEILGRRPTIPLYK